MKINSSRLFNIRARWFDCPGVGGGIYGTIEIFMGLAI